MKFPLPWKWFGALALFLASLLLVVNLCIDYFLTPLLMHDARENLEREAVLAASAFEASPFVTTQERAARIAKRTGLRVTLIAADGRVLADTSREDPSRMENHRDRPEVQAAFHAGQGSSIRHSVTVGVDLLYSAALVEGSSPIVVRVAQPLWRTEQTAGRVRQITAGASALVGLAAIPLLFWMARRSAGPVEEMRGMAMRVAAGDLTARVPALHNGEWRGLGGALNTMAERLESQVCELSEERTELRTTLTHMVEGVLLLDATGGIRLGNRALLEKFSLTVQIRGRTVMEVFRHPELHDFAMQVLAGGAPEAREMTFAGRKDRVFLINAAGMQAAGGERMGAVLVFHDITRLKLLENMRRDFVANVSHELRTPLSIIRGYVETLLDPAPPDPETSHKFLETMHRHALRLESLIADLLTISSLESQQAKLDRAPLRLQEVIADVAGELGRQAAARSVSLGLSLPEGLLSVEADRRRIHQVFFNLLDNAIKYTPHGSQVTVTGHEREGGVEICVADNGPGIAAEHLPHLFERFYRVDQARSRELGGTGLGLSIVKHILLAHGGRVGVKSDPGDGSRFYVWLPLASKFC